ncbi:uncharacterized membrane-anchored protein YjiN (DUF445 family) [Pseudonocardia eucalypti]|nr:uncharacterized membrane-anchored protein YjiN (DUF445 family) [Pseudonocardia eucalypti]
MTTAFTPIGLDPRNAEIKRRGLRRMKLVAAGFLAGATVLFIAAHLWLSAGGPGWLGYVKAAAEAGMVGALADWFAVTALFRRPLGLPIPHTAIIPTKKDLLGDSLGDFVGANFLAEDVVRDKLSRAELPRRLGTWVAEPENAERVTAELATAVRGAVTVLRDEYVQDVLEQVLVKQLMDREWGPPLGKVLSGVLADGAHHRMVDLVCDRAYEWVRGNYDLVMRVVSDQAPNWSPRFVDELVADKVFREVLEFSWAVKTDPDHPLRKAVDKFLVEFADDMQHDRPTIERTEAIKHQLVEHPDVQRFIGKAWGTAKTMLLDAAADPSSALRRRVAQGLASLGERLATDAEFRAKFDGWLLDAAGYVVRHYRAEITTLITDTVDRWDGPETARKVELQVGRDLQYIRINGTVVGALAGLAIYTLSQLLG